MARRPAAVGRVEVFAGRDRQWYWRRVSANGQIVAQSEGYTRPDNARRAAMRNWPDVPLVLVREDR